MELQRRVRVVRLVVGSRATAAGCVLCPAGQYRATPGGPTCANCPGGSTSTAPGATACTACTGNTASSAGGQCITCAAGRGANAAHTGCTVCYPGATGGPFGGCHCGGGDGSAMNLSGTCQTCNSVFRENGPAVTAGSLSYSTSCAGCTSADARIGVDGVCRIILNPGFDNSFSSSNWVPSGSSGQGQQLSPVYTAPYSYVFQPSAPQKSICQTITLGSAGTFSLSSRILAQGSYTSGSLVARYSTVSPVAVVATSPNVAATLSTTEWTLVTLPDQALPAGALNFCWVYDITSSMSVYLDEVQLVRV